MSKRRNNRFYEILFGAVFLLTAGPLITSSQSADLETGLEAFAAGDYGTAASEWRPLAERGDPTAQFNMGLLYDAGLGVPLDTAKAAEWYRLAAQQGVASAQYNLGVLYQMGRGLPFDPKRAFFWMATAAHAENGDIAARSAAARDRLAEVLEPGVTERLSIQALENARSPNRMVLPPGESAPYLALSGREVRVIQENLVRLGFDVGEIDGIAGPRTHQAIGEYLLQHGLGNAERPVSRFLLRHLLERPHSE